MVDWIYCGTNPPVDADGTQGLFRTHHAIWCSPPNLRPWPGTPQPGERLWLVWRNASEDALLLLGGGRLAGNDQERFGTVLLHTSTDIPGVRDEAAAHGYGGGLGMSFLRLEGVVLPDHDPPDVPGFNDIPNALSEATAAQVATLSGLLLVV